MPAIVRRPDGSDHTGITHEAGRYDFGIWRVRPIEEGSVRARVKVDHNCLGRVVSSLMAEVEL